MLIPLEQRVLDAALGLRRDGAPEFHGFQLAKELSNSGRGRTLTSHGTLYKALSRLEEGGLLSSRWEPAHVAEAERRPRRRLYSITLQGVQALEALHQSAPSRVALATQGASYD